MGRSSGSLVWSLYSKIAAMLALAIATWAALLIVGAIIVIVGAALSRSGLGMLTLKALTPERTAANLQKDAHMVKEHT